MGGVGFDPRIGKEGPLPRALGALYKGLYVHGDKVVLSYTVGDMDVLEMPEVIEVDGKVVILRTLNLGPSKSVTKMLLSESSSEYYSYEYCTKCKIEGDWSSELGEWHDKKDAVYAVVMGQLHGSNFEVNKSRAILHLTASEKPRQIKVR